jgi:hypothetical protein
VPSIVATAKLKNKASFAESTGIVPLSVFGEEAQSAACLPKTENRKPMRTDTPNATDADPPHPDCRRCGRPLHPGWGELYVVSILAIADPSPPVFSEADLARDVGAEIRHLIAKMNQLDAQQAQDQVYRRLVFHLCTSCYNRWIEDPTGSPSWEDFGR